MLAIQSLKPNAKQYSFRNLQTIREVASTDKDLFLDLIELYVFNVSEKITGMMTMCQEGQYGRLKGALDALLSSILYFEVDEMKNMISETIGLLNIGFDRDRVETNIVLIIAANHELVDYLSSSFDLSINRNSQHITCL